MPKIPTKEIKIVLRGKEWWVINIPERYYPDGLLGPCDTKDEAEEFLAGLYRFMELEDA